MSVVMGTPIIGGYYYGSVTNSIDYRWHYRRSCDHRTENLALTCHPSYARVVVSTTRSDDGSQSDG